MCANKFLSDGMVVNYSHKHCTYNTQIQVQCVFSTTYDPEVLNETAVLSVFSFRGRNHYNPPVFGYPRHNLCAVSKNLVGREGLREFNSKIQRHNNDTSTFCHELSSTFTCPDEKKVRLVILRTNKIEKDRFFFFHLHVVVTHAKIEIRFR